MAFSEAWTALHSELEHGATIPNWTVHSGFIGEPFKIVSITKAAITIDAPGASNQQSVRRADLEVVYGLWDDYLRRAIPRHKLRPLTRQSKYVISLLKWLSDRSGGELP